MKCAWRFALVVAAVAQLGGCASTSTDGAGERSSPRERTARAGAAPADHPFSKVRLEMNEAEVVEILGRADDENVGLSGRAFNPFYFGPNQTRATWSYRGSGRIIFDRNMYTGTLRVVRVLYNPNEP